MLSYDEWNSAFLTYFLGGASRGTNIYLSTDDDTIEAIGEDLLNLPKGDALRDFGRAVRMRVVREGYRVNAESVYGRLEHGVPRGLAFLCCLVLAASNMSDEATADVNIDNNSSVYNFLGGIQIKDNASKRRIKPFAHALIGAVHNRSKTENITCISNCSNFNSNTRDFSSSDTGFGGAFGGGLDIKINDRIDFRAVQFDYNPVYSRSRVDNNFRFGIGFVFK